MGGLSKLLYAIFVDERDAGVCWGYAEFSSTGLRLWVLGKCL